MVPFEWRLAAALYQGHVVIWDAAGTDSFQREGLEIFGLIYAIVFTNL